MDEEFEVIDDVVIRRPCKGFELQTLLTTVRNLET